MRISLAELKASSGEVRLFSFTAAPTRLPPAAGIVGEIKVAGELKAVGDSFIAQGEIVYTQAFNCDRCLSPAQKELKTAFCEEFRRADMALLLDEAVRADFAEWSFFDGDTIDIFPAVREAIIVNQPLQNLCRLDCRGLCPKCGHDLNTGDCGCDRRSVDLRFAALADFFV